MFQTSVTGTGTVLVQAPGPVEVLELNNQQIKVNGTFAVARSGDLEYTVEKAAKSLLGSAISGEGFVNTLKGTGKVYLAPVPSYATMLGNVVRASTYYSS